MILPFQAGQFQLKFQTPPTYKKAPTPPKGLAKYCPSLYFYTKLIFGPFLWLCRQARLGRCDDFVWVHGSYWFAEQLEELGCSIIVEGLDILENQKEPCVFVANHMSTLETFLLPGIIRPYMPVTFVVKHSLVNLPLFGAVMRSRDPVVLDRKNPREDLNVVLTEGLKRLKSGISLIIFPQSTRMAQFDPQKFNSIGEKLAKKAGVPLIPIALKTDAWTAGKYIKEIAPLRPKRPIHFRFGQVLKIEGPSKEMHKSICEFISNSLNEWSND
ncbi:MAG: 1-acyl-sn-glycerol-3-phosphate acyltransferase [Desulfovibrionaceae bacterium]|nr:1-acyl-sn-glycerol-3-phosphate acyltransferase [Desulfovibrionaceae bacterium]